MCRDYSSVRFGSVTHGHFNHSAGHYISGKRDFSEALKRKSEEQSLRTGIEHRYVPVDVTQKEGLGVTDEGMDSTHRYNADIGKIETKRYM